MPHGVHINTFSRGSISRFLTNNWLTLLTFSFDFGAARSCCCCCCALSAAWLSIMDSASSWLLNTSSSSDLFSSVFTWNFLSSFASGLVAGSEASAMFSLSVGMIFAIGIGDREFDSTSLSCGRFSPLRTCVVSETSDWLSAVGSGEFGFDDSLFCDWVSAVSSVLSVWVAPAFSSPANSSSSPEKS